MSGSRSKKSGGKYDNPDRKADVFASDKKSTAGKLKTERETKQSRLNKLKKQMGW